MGFVAITHVFIPKTSSLNGCLPLDDSKSLFLEMVGNHQPSIKKNGGLPGHWSTAARQYKKARLPNINCAVYRAELFFVAWRGNKNEVVFYVHPKILGNWSNLTDIFQMAWFNHQLENFLNIFFQWFEILSWMVNLTTWKKLETRKDYNSSELQKCWVYTWNT